MVAAAIPDHTDLSRSIPRQCYPVQLRTMAAMNSTNSAPAMSPSPAQLFAGAGPDMLQGAADPWQQAQQQQQAHQQQQQQPQQQTPTYYQNNTPAQPFIMEHVGGLQPMVQGMTAQHYNLPAGSTSQSAASPLAATGDLEAGPPSIDQVWGLVQALQQQMTLSQQQLATLLAAMPAPSGAPPGAQAMPAPSVSGAPPGASRQQQPTLTGPPGVSWPAPEPRNLLREFQGHAAEEDLRDIDKKDVVPPSKYRGDASMWRHWYTKLHTVLTRRDPRWGELLEAVRKRSRDPYSEVSEREIFTSIGVGSANLLLKFKSQLYEYLETYTDGLSHSMVMSGGPRGSLEAFRQMCDEGFSARDRNLRKEYRTVSHPKQATFETLRRAILDWENALAQWELASGKIMAEAEKIMCLEDMCPDALQQH
jgi:hypothetical protein